MVAVGGEGVRSGNESLWSLNHQSLISKANYFEGASGS